MATTARDLLRLSLLLLLTPRLKLTPGMDGGYGLGHYGSYYGGHYGYPYYGYYGKRSADAEPAPAPTADAKADPWYGYYGGHYYGGYPYYGYGHGYGYYWGK